MNPKGAVIIPAPLRNKYEIEPGSMVELVDTGGKIIIFPTVKDPIREARGMLAGGASLTQELLTERAKELEREEAKLHR
jgi:AbrB family looped-hinge helix DNA binding protein